MQEAWYWSIFDAAMTMVAGIGVLFGILLAVYLLYRIVTAVGFVLVVVYCLIFGERLFDGVPYYDEDDYP